MPLKRVRHWLYLHLPAWIVTAVPIIRWFSLRYFTAVLASYSDRNVSPTVEWAAGPHVAELLGKLAQINTMRPTRTCRWMTLHGSDKGSGHNYTTVYSALFRAFERAPIRIFEMGLGSGDASYAFTMGRGARPGCSLRAWKRLFPEARIFGADIDPKSLIQEPRIQTLLCDQLDPAAIRRLWRHAELQAGVDILIDDGLHTFDGNRTFLLESVEHLRPGGYYIVEDIHRSAIPEWSRMLAGGLPARFPGLQFALVTLPHRRALDDNTLLLIHRPK